MHYARMCGIAAFAISALPWLGLGGYAFVIPGLNVSLPRLHLVDSALLYDVVAFPLAFVALLPGLESVIYFSGEGVRTIRPFIVSLFWMVSGTVLIVVSALRGESRRTNRST